MYHRRENKFLEWLKVIGVCLLTLLCVVLFALAKIGLYGGRPECLVIRCVEVIK